MKLEAIVAQRIGEARKAAGLTQHDLGVAAGIEEETAKVRIHQYEHGKHIPPFSMLERLAVVLGKPVTWFVCSEDQKELLIAIEMLGSAERKQTIVSILNLLKDRTT